MIVFFSLIVKPSFPIHTVLIVSVFVENGDEVTIIFIKKLNQYKEVGLTKEHMK